MKKTINSGGGFMRFLLSLLGYELTPFYQDNVLTGYLLNKKGR